MKFSILSVAAAAALAFSSGDALAGPPGHYHGGHNHGGFGHRYHPPGPHLDYHRGHYHYHDGFYRSGPLVPVYPSYSYPSFGYPSYGYGYGSGYSVTVARPGFSLSIGSGSVYPNYGYGYGSGFYSKPYYGGGYYGGGYYGGGYRTPVVIAHSAAGAKTRPGNTPGRSVFTSDIPRVPLTLLQLPSPLAGVSVHCRGVTPRTGNAGQQFVFTATHHLAWG